MKIIVDMMGGDNAPLAVLEGTAQAVKEYGVQVIGVGSEELVRKTAAEHNIPLDGIELVNCTETIEMCDEPARAIRSKKDSSIVVGLNLLKEGKGDAFVSAGSTGALHVGASLIVRTLKGVKRPALATMVPAKNKAYLLLDCGANVECRPEMLAAFAVMGSCYVNKVEGRTAPPWRWQTTVPRKARAPRCSGKPTSCSRQHRASGSWATSSPVTCPTVMWMWWSATALPAMSSSS